MVPGRKTPASRTPARRGRARKAAARTTTERTAASTRTTRTAAAGAPTRRHAAPKSPRRDGRDGRAASTRRGARANTRRRARRGGRRMTRTTIALLTVAGLVLVGAGGLTAAYFWAASGITSSMLAEPPAPLSTLDLYTPEQRANAETIIDVATEQGLGDDAATIGVMTALGESGLRAIDYGDKAGPDSRGLFQQRDNGHWGTLEQRMDPAHSSSMFFRDLKKVRDWQALRPTEVAHAVQRNADSEHYTKFYPPARALVVAILEERAGTPTPTPSILPTELPADAPAEPPAS